jgi:Osmosensitive K+ channel His kinase sensor domain
MEPTNQGEVGKGVANVAGVGKTFQMLADGQAAAQRGLDLVVAYFQPHARPDTIAQIQRMEVLPHRKIDYRERTYEEMDTEAVLRRRPQIALFDELAHTNIPGSQRTKRWEDVQVFLDAGIEVWTKMNVQHIESLNDQIWQIYRHPSARNDAGLGRPASGGNRGSRRHTRSFSQPSEARRYLQTRNGGEGPYGVFQGFQFGRAP